MAWQPLTAVPDEPTQYGAAWQPLTAVPLDQAQDAPQQAENNFEVTVGGQPPSPNVPKIDIPLPTPKNAITDPITDIAKTLGSIAIPTASQIGAGMLAAPAAVGSYALQGGTKLGQDAMNAIMGVSHDQAENNSRQLMDSIRKGLGFAPLRSEDNPDLAAVVPTPQTIGQGVQNLLGIKTYNPKTAVGQGINAVVPTLAGGVGTGMTLPQNIAQTAAGLGAQSAAQAAGAPDWAQDVSALAGGAATHVVGAAIESLRPQAPQTQAAARLVPIAEQNDIPLRQTDVAGPNSFFGKIASYLNDAPFSGAKKFSVEQQQAANKAIAATMGENANAITPETMQNADNRIGQGYEDFAKNNNVQPQNGKAFLKGIGDLQQEWETLDADTQRRLNAQIEKKILPRMNPDGSISGENWNSIQSQLGRDARSAKNNPDYQLALYDLQQRVRGAMRNGLPPDQANKFDTLNSQYRAMLAIEPAAAKAVATGNLDPADLQSGVKRIYRDYAYNDQNALPQLTQALQLLKKPAGGAENASGWISKAAEAAGAPLNLLGANNYFNGAVGKTGYAPFVKWGEPIKSPLQKYAADIGQQNAENQSTNTGFAPKALPKPPIYGQSPQEAAPPAPAPPAPQGAFALPKPPAWRMEDYNPKALPAPGAITVDPTGTATPGTASAHRAGYYPFALDPAYQEGQPYAGDRYSALQQLQAILEQNGREANFLEQSSEYASPLEAFYRHLLVQRGAGK